MLNTNLLKKTTKRGIHWIIIADVMIVQQNNIYGIYIKNYFQILLQMNSYLIS